MKKMHESSQRSFDKLSSLMFLFEVSLPILSQCQSTNIHKLSQLMLFLKFRSAFPLSVRQSGIMRNCFQTAESFPIQKALIKYGMPAHVSKLNLFGNVLCPLTRELPGPPKTPQKWKWWARFFCEFFLFCFVFHLVRTERIALLQS